MLNIIIIIIIMYDYTSNNWNHWNSDKSLEAIPGKHAIDSLQMTAIFGKSHTIQKLLQSETRSLSGGDHHWFKRNTREIQACYKRQRWRRPQQQQQQQQQQQRSSSSSSSSKPVVIGVTGTISKSLRQDQNNIPGKHEIKELKKKTAILGTAHTLRRVLK